MNKEINKHCFKERFQDEDCIILDIWQYQLINCDIHVSTIKVSISGKFLAIGRISINMNNLKTFHDRNRILEERRMLNVRLKCIDVKHILMGEQEHDSCKNFSNNYHHHH